MFILRALVHLVCLFQSPALRGGFPDKQKAANKLNAATIVSIPCITGRVS